MHVDAERLGGSAWLDRTSGNLTGSERRSLYGTIAKTYVEFGRGTIRLATGRRPKSIEVAPPVAPDSPLARDAENMCREAGSHIAGHGFRTWVFGSILAGLDGATLDPELFYVATLLHDHGLQETVSDEAFTVRSGSDARTCLERHHRHIDVDPVRDAISIHCHPGANVEADGELGTYLQAGALTDIVGFRIWDLPKSIVDDVLAGHDRTGFLPEIRRLINREATAVPAGHFALLRRTGFALATRTSLLR